MMIIIILLLTLYCYETISLHEYYSFLNIINSYNIFLHVIYNLKLVINNKKVVFM